MKANEAANGYLPLAEVNQGLADGKSRRQALSKAAFRIVRTMTPDGAATDSEDEWKAFTGKTGADVRTEALHPDDRASAAAKWAEATRTRAAYEMEQRVYRPDGEYCWMLVRVTPVLNNNDGSILEWIGNCTDISECKLPQAEIRNLHQCLERRVRERTAEPVHASGTVVEIRTEFQAAPDAASEASIVAPDTQGTINVFRRAPKSSWRL
jgi:PAS domain S-box-containing protein